MFGDAVAKYIQNPIPKIANVLFFLFFQQRLDKSINAIFDDLRWQPVCVCLKWIIGVAALDVNRGFSLMFLYFIFQQTRDDLSSFVRAKVNQVSRAIKMKSIDVESFAKS